MALGMLERLPKLCAELINREDVTNEVKTMVKKLTATARRYIACVYEVTCKG